MQLTGIGLYTFHEAALLTRIPLRDLRRWLRGYSYRDKKHGPVSVGPLLETELADNSLDGVSFHDLLEVRFVHAFRKHGVGLQAIRLRQRACARAFQDGLPVHLTPVSHGRPDDFCIGHRRNRGNREQRRCRGSCRVASEPTSPQPSGASSCILPNPTRYRRESPVH